MMKKYLPVCLLTATMLAGSLGAQQAVNPTQSSKPASSAHQSRKVEVQVASQTAKVDPVVLTNQMMLVFMERMKTGNLKEARDIADEMVFGNEKFVDTDRKVFKSFHSAMEKELFLLNEQRSGGSREVEWVEQPISDGFYFLAILNFQENKHEEALASMQKAIFWNPVRSAFYAERGFMFLRKNNGPDIIGAQIAYEKALELADNQEDFAAALRGLAFVLVERRELEKALACLVVSKEFDANDDSADEEIQFIKRADPALVDTMTLPRARDVLKDGKILYTYSPDHTTVLMKLADSMESPEDKQKAILLLKKAKEMSPKNAEVKSRLQKLQKK
jgi:tetratricopeptide (TPR) repeat protein